ncbi:hypothetical protein COT52_01600 [candidate division WWE3 bacterium CG08_land_8_20_14_0_20_43_13]|uniref:DNA polymerase III subunit gamma/tau n=1 Tax=candidate division WWE3 bacterium CG08_land_8_20_14_0_20_43_13 TaxID=1975087 RepID=A0A2H0X9U3_UNCKA|nr:MAG: hypothetical protein COT52_01600 [candidate division WWE3 bacterium CG08_land_8_20_14_0_20_43_13]
MFYSKYRPQQFKDLIGAETIVKTLKKSLAEGKFGHAYFFSGPRGSGKTTTARLLAKALNCLNLGSDGEPCDQCSSCEAIKKGNFLDVMEIDAASNRGIDDIRDLREKVKLASAQGKYKVYIIDEVHMLTKEAFNALLKTLEEPPAHVVFVLCTTEPRKVPETIRSRCQKFGFKRAGRVDLIRQLQLIVDQEDVVVAQEDLGRIVDASDGGFRDAENLLEQLIVGGLSISELLGGSQTDSLEFVKHLIDLDLGGCFNLIDDLFSSGASLEVFAQDCVETLRQIMLVSGGVGEELVETTRERYQQLKELSLKLKPSDLRQLLDLFLEALPRFARSPIVQLPLELLASTYISPKSISPTFINNSLPLVPDDRLSDSAKPVRIKASLPVEKPKSRGEELVEDSSAAGDPRRIDWTQENGDSNITLELICRLWEEFLEKVRPHNHSLRALLSSSRPKECLEGGVVVLEMFYQFHLEKVKEPKNMEILEKVLAEVTKRPVKIKCVLGDRSTKPAISVAMVNSKVTDSSPADLQNEVELLAKKARAVFGELGAGY